jgi:hypothetical protein
MNRVNVADQTYCQILYSAGIYIFDPKTGEYVFGKQKKAAQKALDFMIELYKKASPLAINPVIKYTNFRQFVIQLEYGKNRYTKASSASTA